VAGGPLARHWLLLRSTVRHAIEQKKENGVNFNFDAFEDGFSHEVAYRGSCLPQKSDTIFGRFPAGLMEPV
jgi:hypothetical protein